MQFKRIPVHELQRSYDTCGIVSQKILTVSIPAGQNFPAVAMKIPKHMSSLGN